MKAEESNGPKKPATAPGPEMELCARPASEWLQELKSWIDSLSAHREDLRREMQMELGQRNALNLKGEKALSPRAAREMAKGVLLGPGWSDLHETVQHARQRVLSARRQLQTLASAAVARRQSSNRWTYWLIHAPLRAWKARPLRRRLSQADGQRREALVGVRALRAQLRRPDMRARVFHLTQTFLLKEESLRLSLQSREEVDQKVSATLSTALQLAPRLRDLGDELFTMKRPVNLALRATTLPVPAEPLYAPKPGVHRAQGLRVH